MRDLQKLDQALHPLLDELLALFGGMGQVIAFIRRKKTTIIMQKKGEALLI